MKLALAVLSVLLIIGILIVAVTRILSVVSDSAQDPPPSPPPGKFVWNDDSLVKPAKSDPPKPAKSDPPIKYFHSKSTVRAVQATNSMYRIQPMESKYNTEDAATILRVQQTRDAEQKM